MEDLDTFLIISTSWSMTSASRISYDPLLIQDQFPGSRGAN